MDNPQIRNPLKLGFPRVPYLDHHFFYIYDLPEGLISVPKLFADDTSLFSAVHEPKTT